MTSRANPEPGRSTVTSWRGRHPRVAGALRVLLVTAVLLVVIEGALLALGIPDGPATTTAERDELLDRRLYEPDARLLWRLRRSATLDVPEAGFPGIRTNAAGLRGEELPPPGRDGAEIRVVCLGDSVMFGLGLGEEETVASRLAAALRRTAPAGARVRVINAGIPGHSLVQGRRLLEELRPLRPDAVVLWYGANDAKPALGASDAQMRVAGPFAADVLDALRVSRLWRVIEDATRPAPAAAPAGFRATPAETTEGAAEVQRLGAADGFAAVFVRGPTRFADKKRQFERILSSARDANAKFVDGSNMVLSYFVTAETACEQIASIDVKNDGVTLRLAPGPGGRSRIPVAELAQRLDDLRGWETRYAEHLAALPADAFDGTAALGGAPGPSSMNDDIHLTAEGARLVGEALAKRLEAEFEARGAARAE